VDRRAFLAAALAVSSSAIAGVSFARRRETDALRIGVMTNLTHAPLLAGLGSGRIARALSPTKIETRVFRSGPRVVEALFGGAIDVGTAGPAAIVIHHARHAARGNPGLRVLTGCASGGASLMVARGIGVTAPSDLLGKRLAVTQIGTTQDVALRSWLRAHALGDEAVMAVPASVILDQMRRGDLHGTWIGEPWATRLEHELGAVRLVDERDLWPGRRFASAALAARAESSGDEPLRRLVHALEDEVARAQSNPRDVLEEAYTELRRHIGNPGSRSVFDAAARYMDFTSDPVASSFLRFAEYAAALRFTSAPGAAEHLFQ
jgi:NitT/TauT family transport system substrate-binding protein